MSILFKIILIFYIFFNENYPNIIDIIMEDVVFSY